MLDVSCLYGMVWVGTCGGLVLTLCSSCVFCSASAETDAGIPGQHKLAGDRLGGLSYNGFVLSERSAYECESREVDGDG